MTDVQATPVDVTVGVCVRNGARTIERQLHALDRQVDHPPFDVIVVDNGSTDGTPDLVRSWIAAPKHAHVRARLIDGGKKPGIPRVRNIVIANMTGRVLLFCDADDEVDARWVGEFARNVPANGMAGGRVEAVASDGTPRPDAFNHGLNGSPYLPWAPGSNLALTRVCLDIVRGYDESLPRYGFEDLTWLTFSGLVCVSCTSSTTVSISAPSRTSASTPALDQNCYPLQIILGKVRSLHLTHQEPSTGSDHCSLEAQTRASCRSYLRRLTDMPMLRQATEASAKRIGFM